MYFLEQLKRRRGQTDRNLIYLVYNRGLIVTKTKPDGVTINLKNGTWTFEKDPHAERRGPYKIGTDSRYLERNDKWGPVGVYNQKDFRHIKNMVFDITEHTREDGMHTIEVD